MATLEAKPLFNGVGIRLSFGTMAASVDNDQLSAKSPPLLEDLEDACAYGLCEVGRPPVFLVRPRMGDTDLP